MEARVFAKSYAFYLNIQEEEKKKRSFHVVVTADTFSWDKVRLKSDLVENTRGQAAPMESAEVMKVAWGLDGLGLG